jgi:SOS response regulatory protein OraA/RecX
MLAFLIDRNGADVSSKEIAAALWEDGTKENNRNYFHQLLFDVRQALEKVGAGDVLKKNGYVSDERFCRRKCETLSEGKLFGRRRIVSELMAKGISYELCDKVIDSMEIDFYANLQRLFEKITAGEIPETREQKKKIFDKLLRYGYSYDEINDVFSEYTDI